MPLSEKQKEMLRDAQRIAVERDQRDAPLWGSFQIGSAVKNQEFIRKWAMSKGMHPAEFFREIEAPNMPALSREAAAFTEEALSMASLGIVPALARAAGIQDDKKLTQGIGAEFNPGEYLPESLKGGVIEEQLTGVSPSRVAGGLAGGMVPATAGAKLMQKAFGVSPGLSSAAGQAAKAGVKLPGAAPGIGARVMDAAASPKAIQAMEMGMGFGALEAPAEIIRSKLAGKEVTVDNVVEAVTIGIGTGLAFDAFIQLVPAALRGSREQMMNLRQAYKSRQMHAKVRSVQPDVDNLVVEFNKRGGLASIGEPPIGEQAPRMLPLRTDLVETGPGTFRSDLPDNALDKMYLRGVAREVAPEVAAMEAELANGAPLRLEPIRDDIPLANVGRNAHFIDDDGAPFRVTKPSTRQGVPVEAESLEDGLLYLFEPDVPVMTVSVTGEIPDPVLQIEKATRKVMGIRPATRQRGVNVIELEQGGGNRGGRRFRDDQGPNGEEIFDDNMNITREFEQEIRDVAGEPGEYAPERPVEPPGAPPARPAPEPREVPKGEGPAKPVPVRQSMEQLNELMDAGLQENTLTQMEEAFGQVKGERRLRDLKKRLDDRFDASPEAQADPVLAMARARVDAEVQRIEVEAKAAKASDQFGPEEQAAVIKKASEADEAAKAGEKVEAVAEAEVEAAPKGDTPAEIAEDAAEIKGMIERIESGEERLPAGQKEQTLAFAKKQLADLEARKAPEPEAAPAVEGAAEGLNYANGKPVTVGDRIEWKGQRLAVMHVDPAKRAISGTYRGKPVTVELGAKGQPKKLGRVGKVQPKNNVGSVRAFVTSEGISLDSVKYVDRHGNTAYKHNLEPEFVKRNTGPNKLFRKDGGRSMDALAEALDEAPVEDVDMWALQQSVRARGGNKDQHLSGDDLGPLLPDREFMDRIPRDDMVDEQMARWRDEAEEMGWDADDVMAANDEFDIDRIVADVEPEAPPKAPEKAPAKTASNPMEQMAMDAGKRQVAGARGNAGKPAAGAQQALQGTPLDPDNALRAADEAAGSQNDMFASKPAEANAAKIAELERDIKLGRESIKRSSDSSADPFEDSLHDDRLLLADLENQLKALKGENPSIGGAAGRRPEAFKDTRVGNRMIHMYEKSIFGEGVESTAEARLFREHVTGKNNPLQMTGQEQADYLAHLKYRDQVRSKKVAVEQDDNIAFLEESGASDIPESAGGKAPPGDMAGKVDLDPEIPDQFQQEIPPGYWAFQTPTSESNLSGTFLGSMLVRGGKIPEKLRQFFVGKDGIVPSRFLGGVETLRLMYKDLGEMTSTLHKIAEEASLDVGSGRKVFRALDGQIEPTTLEPRLKQVHDRSRAILDGLADRLGIAPGQKISAYAPHIFQGRLGELLAHQVAGEQGMDVAAAVVSRDWRGRPVSTPRVPKEKFFAHLLKRKGVEGFEQDWTMVMQAYTRGALQKIYLDQFLKEARTLISQTPRHLVLRDEMSKYAYYVAGGTTKTKQAMARFLGNSDIFNQNVDRMMALLVPGDTKKSLGMMRDSPDELLDWYRQVVEASRIPEGPEAILSKGRFDRARNQAAIKLDDIRAALTNPNSGPVLLNQLYRIQAWHKLGGNLAHLVTNSTQFLVNSVPELGPQAAYRGAHTFINYQMGGQKALKIKVGKVETSVKSLLGEVRFDTPAHSEFLTPSRFGRKFSVLEDIVFKPSQWSEYWNRGATLLGKYEDALRKGGLADSNPRQAHQDALAAALKAEQKTQFIFNRSGTPKALRSPIMRTMFMFQSYTLHQINFSWDIFRAMAINPSKENATKLALHLGSYAALIGPGMMAGYETSERYSHPIVDKLSQVKGEGFYGEPPLIQALGGPWASSVWNTTQWIVGNQDGGRFLQRTVLPAQVSRTVKAVTQEEGLNVPLRALTGIRPVREKQKGRLRSRR